MPSRGRISITGREHCRSRKSMGTSPERRLLMSESEEKIKVTVKIYGEDYVVKGYAKPGYIEGIGAYVDKKMHLIGQKNPHLSLTKVAVLAALNISDELYKLQEDYDSLAKLLEEEKLIK
jgi:cell division protein ZapA